LEELADYVHLTPAYLSYLFKKETGQTLVSFMTDVKMKHAKLLLKEQSLKIIQIGRMLGYENQSYFNRLFKNYYGMTPRQYRETL
jgi:two-component system response regulator YesN